MTDTLLYGYMEENNLDFRSFLLQVQAGNISGALVVNKFGSAFDFDTADGEVTVWDGAEDGTNWENMVYDYSTTADIDSISSSDNSDTVVMEIQGLDSDYDLIVQEVTLTGQTRAALTIPLIRIFRAKNVGSTDLAGHVFLYPNTPLGGAAAGIPTDKSKIRCVVHPSNNQTEMALYTVPNGYSGFLLKYYAHTSGASKSSQYVFTGYARPYGQVFQLKQRFSISDAGSTSFAYEYLAPPKFPEKTDLELRVSATAVGATGAAVSGGFDILLLKN